MGATVGLGEGVGTGVGVVDGVAGGDLLGSGLAAGRGVLDGLTLLVADGEGDAVATGVGVALAVVGLGLGVEVSANVGAIARTNAVPAESDISPPRLSSDDTVDFELPCCGDLRRSGFMGTSVSSLPNCPFTTGHALTSRLVARNYGPLPIRYIPPAANPETI